MVTVRRAALCHACRVRIARYRSCLVLLALCHGDTCGCSSAALPRCGMRYAACVRLRSALALLPRLRYARIYRFACIAATTMLRVRRRDGAGRTLFATRLAQCVFQIQHNVSVAQCGTVAMLPMPFPYLPLPAVVASGWRTATPRGHMDNTTLGLRYWKRQLYCTARAREGRRPPVLLPVTHLPNAGRTS